ncbi:MAG: SDR family oxidoreductase [Deltaproteobacteria bacterium]|nr:SDR family oxidoreductase [Deltaproteobacteria bacterium]
MAKNPFDLSGKTALITGGNGGIGLGMAKSLAQAGANVCIWGRNEAKNEAAKKELEAIGGGVLAIACDVADENQVEAAFAETVKTFGRVDSCFANAGIPAMGTRFHEMTTSEWRKVFSVNMEGAFFTFRAAVRHMLQKGGGSLVATGSISALSGMPRGEHYAATKGGLLSMVKALSVEYAKNGIRANVVVPGWIETQMTEPLFAWDRFRDKVLPRIPVGRWGEPSDFGGIAVYLTSDASAYHTGDVMIIDGAYINF